MILTSIALLIIFGILLLLAIPLIIVETLGWVILGIISRAIIFVIVIIIDIIKAIFKIK